MEKHGINVANAVRGSSEWIDNRWRSRRWYLIIGATNFRASNNGIITIYGVAIDAATDNITGGTIRSTATKQRYIESCIVVIITVTALIRIMMVIIIIRTKTIRRCFCWPQKYVGW